MCAPRRQLCVQRFGAWRGRVSMDLCKLSLPSGGVAGVNLADNLKGRIQEMALRFEDYMLEDPDSWLLKKRW